MSPDFNIMPKIVDLFGGIGGMSLGAARAGFRIALSVDKDAILSRIHEANFPEARHWIMDVKDLSGVDLLDALEPNTGDPIFGVIGGSPCQGFSRIGKRNKHDKRNLLFLEFFRLVSETMPAFFVAENVPGILDDQYSHIIQLGLESVKGSYHLMDPIVLDAADFGAATVRKRVFFIGYRPGRLRAISPGDFDQRKWKVKTQLGYALKGLPSKIRKEWDQDENGWRPVRLSKNGTFSRKIMGEIPAGVGDPLTVSKLVEFGLVSGCIATEHSESVRKRFSLLNPGEIDSVSRSPRLTRTGLSPTLRAGTAKDRGSFQSLRPIHFAEDRVITPREAARIQGFPDWFRLHETKWHSFRGIGNSVSPLLAESMFKVLAEKLIISDRP